MSETFVLLTHAHQDAASKLWDLQRKIAAISREKIAPLERDFEIAKRAIHAEVQQQHAAEYAAAEAEAIAAEKALVAEKDRIALLGQGAPFPIGSTVRETHQYSRWGLTEVPKVNQRTGVFEVVTSETKLSRSGSGMRHPVVGEYIIRLHKKDGKLGLAYVYNFRNNVWSVST